LEAVRERPALRDRRPDRLLAGAGRGGAPSCWWRRPSRLYPTPAGDHL